MGNANIFKANEKQMEVYNLKDDKFTKIGFSDEFTYDNRAIKYDITENNLKLLDGKEFTMI